MNSSTNKPLIWSYNSTKESICKNGRLFHFIPMNLRKAEDLVDFLNSAETMTQPQKMKRIPLGPEDFPPGTVVRIASAAQKVYWAAIAKVTIEGIYHRDGAMDYAGLMAETERSIDSGKTWLPCYKEVPES